MENDSFNFNLHSYQNMLTEALEVGYEFISFVKAQNLIKEKPDEISGTCILRHDIDVNIKFALKMAQLEYELGIRSTYFLMFRSPFYNLTSRYSQDCVEKIIDLGHEIALHYDLGYDTLKGYSANRSIKEINNQAAWMEELFCCNVASVSFHQPSQALLNEGINISPRLNTYEKSLKSKYTYFSDSNRNISLLRRYENKENLKDKDLLSLRYPEDIQLLIHPIWWVLGDKDINTVWNKAIIDNFETAQLQALFTEKKFGNQRILQIK
jgi:hypothetical protein